MGERRAVPLSVLDIVPIFDGMTPSQAVRNSIELARRVEQLGYRRHWFAEHHNIPGVGVSTPAVMAAHVAAITTTLRVGAGGVMLPNHPPLVAAEQFTTLAVLYPDRVDLGLGRAPGTDPMTAQALRRVATSQSGEGFETQIRETLSYLGDGPVGGPRIVAMPVAETPPTVWLLGSSMASARLAGSLGLPFAFAHHLGADTTVPALAAYRETFTPSGALERPYTMVAAFVVVADTDERADWLAGPAKMSIVHVLGGRPGLHTTEEQAAAYRFSEFEAEVVDQRIGTQIVGGPDTARRRVTDLLDRTGADELMALTTVRGLDDRVHSYQLLADIMHGQPTANLGPVAVNSQE